MIASGPIIYIIGFAGKSAEQFFSHLMKAGVQKVIDIRLHNGYQKVLNPIS